MINLMFLISFYKNLISDFGRNLKLLFLFRSLQNFIADVGRNDKFFVLVKFLKFFFQTLAKILNLLFFSQILTKFYCRLWPWPLALINSVCCQILIKYF